MKLQSKPGLGVQLKKEKLIGDKSLEFSLE